MIRFAEEADRTAVMTLWNRCFHDDPTFAEWYFANRYRPEETLLLIEDNTLCAMVQMLPYSYRNGAAVSEVTYIYGACTAPEQRFKGYMATLLQESFRIDVQRGRTASVLIPAEPWLFDFYKKYGYETAFAVTDRLISFDGQPHFDGTVRSLTEEDCGAMQKLYEELLTVPHLTRSEQDWRDQFRMFLALNGMVLGWFSDTGALLGYAFIWKTPEELWAQELMSVQPEEMAQQILRHCGELEIKITTPGEQRALGCLRPHTKDEVWPGYFNLLFN